MDISAWNILESTTRVGGGERSRHAVDSPSRPNEDRDLAPGEGSSDGARNVRLVRAVNGSEGNKRLTSESSFATTPASSFPVGVPAGLSHSPAPAYRSYCRFISVRESRAIVTRVESRDHRCHVLNDTSLQRLRSPIWCETARVAATPPRRY